MVFYKAYIMCARGPKWTMTTVLSNYTGNINGLQQNTMWHNELRISVDLRIKHQDVTRHILNI